MSVADRIFVTIRAQCGISDICALRTIPSTTPLHWVFRDESNRHQVNKNPAEAVLRGLFIGRS